MFRAEQEPAGGEPGAPYRISDLELASRLSFFLWGSTPADWLLDRAEEGGLSTPADVAEAAAMMLADERALDRMHRFHGMWLGYETLPFGGELADAIAESFGSFEKFRTQLSKAAATTQGSGWGVLAYEPVSGRLIQVVNWQDIAKRYAEAKERTPLIGP